MSIKLADFSAASSLFDQAAQHVLRPRNRIRLLAVLALAVLTTCWLLYSTPGLQQTGQPRSHNFTSPKDHSTWDDTLASSRLDWVKAHAGTLIPANIWQIMLPKVWGGKFVVHSGALKETSTWLAMNPDYA